VSFTDLTQNIPQTWLWDFGDGTTSNIQNPIHTYTADGTYTVILTCTNANGSDADTMINYITVNTAGAVLPASCSPQTTSYCCGYGIYQVTFNTISNISADATEGYQDFSCQHQTTVYGGNLYNLTVKTGVNNPQDTRVWIDFNNDGIFASTELILDNQSGYNPSANILIPASGVVLQTPLRMRIRSDIVSTPKSACDAPLYGQIEDYAVIIDTLPTPPLADFSSDIRFTCNDSIHFYDLSSNNPTSWNWSFGDGGTSTQQNPVYKYNNPGTYNVALTAANAGGSSSKIKYNYIIVNCDTAEIPVSGNEVYTSCSGFVFDDGRSLNYNNNVDGSITIQPINTSVISLQFLSFSFAPGDSLFIYNSAIMNNSTLIGAYSGNTVPATIYSATGFMTIREKTDSSNNDSGFLAEWTCSNSINEIAAQNHFSVYPNPTQGIVFIENFSGKKISSITLYNVVGKHIVTLSNPLNSINLNNYNLSNGIYFIEINKKCYYKISKQ
jgi:PKD repeat protein